MTHPIICNLFRNDSSNDGTFGNFVAEEIDFQCLSLELPDRNNKPMRGCILAGIYNATWAPSKRKKRDIYRLEDRHGRTGILIHSASFAGDELLKLESDLEGCIALGERRTIMINQNGKSQSIMTGSRAAVKTFERLANGRPLLITIHDILK